MSWQPWPQAWQQALYGPEGFYLRPEGPAGHFRTAAHAAPEQLAAATARLAAEHGCTRVVDLGAGRGELARALAPLLPVHCVDLVERPAGLPATIGWSNRLDRLPGAALREALVVSWELLDVVPCPVLEVDGEGVLREVEVEPRTGRERLGAPADAGQLAWCATWWPAPEGGYGPEDEGARVEVGLPRDELWARVLTRARSGGARAAVAVDYGHRRTDRPPTGSLTGFRGGRAVPPRPDGSCDLTAHVALDAVADAVRRETGCGSRLCDQGTRLGELEVTRAELLDPGALGGFGWLETPLH